MRIAADMGSIPSALLDMYAQFTPYEITSPFSSSDPSGVYPASSMILRIFSSIFLEFLKKIFPDTSPAWLFSGCSRSHWSSSSQDAFRRTEFQYASDTYSVLA